MFVTIFLALLVYVPILFWLLPYAISLVGSFGFAGAFGAVFAPLFLLHAILSVPFALRDLSSSDQFKMFGKLVLVMDVVFPLAMVALYALNFYIFDNLGWIGAFLHTPRLFGFFVILEFFGVLVVVKKFFGDRISRLYHLKPLSEVAAMKQAEKYLASADKRLRRKQFEGASQEFNSAAQVYISLGDWANAAKYYWSAAETLSKDSSRFGFGVSLLYVLSAAAYLLCNDLEKVNEAMRLASEISKKPKIDSRGEISFMLDILDRIRNKNVQQLREDWPRLARKIGKEFGPYSEEMVILLEKNLGLSARCCL